MKNFPKWFDEYSNGKIYDGYSNFDASQKDAWNAACKNILRIVKRKNYPVNNTVIDELTVLEKEIKEMIEK